MGGLSTQLQAELVGRLLLSVLLGGVLGWERQMGQHPAGLRTHIMVALGSAAYTIAGTYGPNGLGTAQDATRVAAQVVTGIGFLGAGTIWRSGSDRIIYGLTTAASIWVAASIGMLAAFGLYTLAAGCALIGFGVLRLLKGLEQVSLPIRIGPLGHRRRAGTSGSASGHAGAADQRAGEGDENGADTVVATLLMSQDALHEAQDIMASSEPGTPGPAGRKPDRHKTRKRKRRREAPDSPVQISDSPLGGGN